jgi:dUTPase-like protein
MSSFLALLRAQDDLQKKLGHDLQTMSADERIDYIKEMTLAQFSEMNESLGEVGWKSWATSRHINTEAYLGELIDELHFWMNRVLALGMPPEDLAIAVTSRYFAKRERNIQRQAKGYDGVSGKCAGCNRDLEDSGVRCHIINVEEARYWCEVYGEIDGNPTST